MAWQVPGYRHRADLGSTPGRVVLAVHESSGELAIIKYLNADEFGNSSDSGIANKVHEVVHGIRDLPSDHFGRTRELVEDSGRFAVVMDAINGATLRALIRDEGGLGAEG